MHIVFLKKKLPLFRIIVKTKICFSRKRFPTFTRMVPKFTRVITSVLALLDNYKWYKFSIITQEDSEYENVARSLQAEGGLFYFTSST